MGMDVSNLNVAARLADALVNHPDALADLNFFAQDAAFPHTARGQAAFARQILATIAPYLTDRDIRRLAATVGAHAETPDDVDRIARIGALAYRRGEQALAGLMLDALAPSPRWLGLDGLSVALNSKAAYAIALVVAGLPRTEATR